MIKKLIGFALLPLVIGLGLNSQAFALTNDQLNLKVRQLENQVNYLMSELDKYNEYQTSIDQLRNQIEINTHQINQTNKQLAEIKKTYDQKLSEIKKNIQTSKTKAQNPQDVLFDKAYNLMLKRQYKSALSGFSDYVKRYYNGKYYSKSLYYMGVLYLTQGDIKDAKARFKTIVDRYPKSVKYPDALVQLGAIYRVEGNTKLARNYFNKVIKNYPDTKAATLAKSELNKVK